MTAFRCRFLYVEENWGLLASFFRQPKSLVVPCVNISAVVQKESNNIRVATSRGVKQSFMVVGLSIRSMLQEKFDNFCVAVGCGYSQRSIISRVNIRATLKEFTNTSDVAICGAYNEVGVFDRLAWLARDNVIEIQFQAFSFRACCHDDLAVFYCHCLCGRSASLSRTHRYFLLPFFIDRVAMEVNGL